MLHEKLNAFRWINEPAEWSIGQSLEVRTRPDTDYWQRTHYGFQGDNGHFYFINILYQHCGRLHLLATGWL